jgi:16S rRNA processing protein RimM
MQPKHLILGEILRPHGVRGEVRVRLLTDFPERISKLERVYLGKDPDSIATPYGVESMRRHQEHGLLKLKGIDDRDAADRLRQLLVMIDLAHAVPLEAGEFYLYQLIGVEVRTEAGEVLGTLTEVLETRANDVYVVKSPRYGEILIPALPETIIKTDIPAKQVIVRLPEGLLPGQSEEA